MAFDRPIIIYRRPCANLRFILAKGALPQNMCLAWETFRFVQHQVKVFVTPRVGPRPNLHGFDREDPIPVLLRPRHVELLIGHEPERWQIQGIAREINTGLDVAKHPARAIYLACTHRLRRSGSTRYRSPSQPVFESRYGELEIKRSRLSESTGRTSFR